MATTLGTLTVSFHYCTVHSHYFYSIVCHSSWTCKISPHEQNKTTIPTTDSDVLVGPYLYWLSMYVLRVPVWPLNCR